MNLTFHNPEFLFLLILVPLAAFIGGKPGFAAGVVFSNTKIANKVSQKKRSRVGKFLLSLKLLALTSLILAMARPQLGKGESFINASGIDIVMAIDLSSSMLALDFSSKTEYVTRLEAAKKVTDDFIEKRKYDRIGIIAFAGNPYLVSPLTLNHNWLESNLKRLEVGLIEDGTAIGDAIAMSVNRLKDLESKSRVIILLTDGANTAGEISPIAAAEAAAAFKTKIYTVAAGTGGIVPTFALGQDGKIVRTQYGQPEVFRADYPVDEDTLIEIAEITGGKNYSANNLEELKDIYDEINNLEKTDVTLKTFAQFDDFFHIPLIIGLGLILLELIASKTFWRRLP